MGHTTKQTTKEITIHTFNCDWCGERLKIDIYHPTPCGICSRYGCSEHKKKWIDLNGISDYPDYVCHDCQKFRNLYIDKIDELDREMERLEDEWRRKAKNEAKKKN